MVVNRKIFFDEYRKILDPDKNLTEQEVKDIDLFLDFFERDFKIFSVQQWSYIFATVFHETGATFHPLRESPRMSDEWRKKNFRYFPYYGRGYVQITWDYNYKTYSNKLKIDLIKNPDLAMIPSNSWFILVDGFKNGIFTGKKISDYINDNKIDYINARRCINSTDKAVEISKYAKSFESILKKII